VRRADNLTTFMCRLSRNSGASTSWNPKGLSRPVAGKLYLFTSQGICTRLLGRLSFSTLQSRRCTSAPCFLQTTSTRNWRCWLTLHTANLRISDRLVTGRSPFNVHYHIKFTPSHKRVYVQWVHTRSVWGNVQNNLRFRYKQNPQSPVVHFVCQSIYSGNSYKL
jgi:hypothetical protein